MSALFSHPKIPMPPVPKPPVPQKGGVLNAELAQMGRRQGLMAALFGANTKSSGSTSSHTITGQ
jgi:hypothetical protein